jgi:hypothetical protein
VAIEGGAGVEDSGTALLTAKRRVSTGDENSGGAIEQSSTERRRA